MSEGLKLYKVEIHEDAASMLFEHVTFLTNVSISAALRLRKTIADAIDSLSNYPQRCPIYELKKVRGNYRRLISGRYSIVFSIDETEGIVLVKYILDSRQSNDL